MDERLILEQKIGSGSIDALLHTRIEIDRLVGLVEVTSVQRAPGVEGHDQTLQCTVSSLVEALQASGHGFNSPSSANWIILLPASGENRVTLLIPTEWVEVILDYCAKDGSKTIDAIFASCVRELLGE